MTCPNDIPTRRITAKFSCIYHHYYCLSRNWQYVSISILASRLAKYQLPILQKQANRVTLDPTRSMIKIHFCFVPILLPSHKMPHMRGFPSLSCYWWQWLILLLQAVSGSMRTEARRLDVKLFCDRQRGIAMRYSHQKNSEIGCMVATPSRAI